MAVDKITVHKVEATILLYALPQRVVDMVVKAPKKPTPNNSAWLSEINWASAAEATTPSMNEPIKLTLNVAQGNDEVGNVSLM